MTKITCIVDSVEPLTAHVSKVLLTPTPAVTYLPGQYLQLCLSEEDKRPFSIASTPDQTQLELHIGAADANQYNNQALIHLQQQQKLQLPVTVEASLGQAYWRNERQNPIVLLAGGTGFSYIYSIARAIAAAGYNQPVFLYWGVRQPDALYYEQELQRWAETNPLYRVIPVVQQAPANWPGRSGLVHEAVLEDFVSLEAYDIYIAGPFAMAGIAREAFSAQGAQRDNMFADAFAYI